ncbi:alpha/beta hydrolase [Kitasatospora sp. NPDC094028]
MRIGTRTFSDGVVQYPFTLGAVPGVLWRPTGPMRYGRPLVLLGHGGGGHKLAPGLVDRARRFVADAGSTAVALDAPGHGERPRTPADERFGGEIAELQAAGRPISAWVARHTTAVAERAVPEWTAVLDALREEGEGCGRVGFWGLSLGSVIGIPLAAAEPRIGAAVFGLTGHESQNEPAGRVTAPLDFLMQWDDALVPRAGALALYGAFGSPDRTLHANPGGHGDVPERQLAAAEGSLRRRLLGEE